MNVIRAVACGSNGCIVFPYVEAGKSNSTCKLIRAVVVAQAKCRLIRAITCRSAGWRHVRICSVEKNRCVSEWLVHTSHLQTFGLNRKLQSQILAGAIAMRWAIWISINDVVFDKGIVPSYLQVVFRGTHWTRFWSLLQKEEDRPVVKAGCRLFESAAIEVFATHG
uniref:Reverse transcriptase zinc-binding domain-containing protein n=1 Tax=Setaria viridis TaxID=4556 RepID=A0A4V6DBT3_SETVI|nr:hypothetical protein SEVIR_2G314250v2 [Setaria viridis]